MSWTLSGAVQGARDAVAVSGVTDPWRSLALDLVELARPEEDQGVMSGYGASLIKGTPLELALRAYDALVNEQARVQAFQSNLVMLFNEATPKASKLGTVPDAWYQLGDLWGAELERVNLADLVTDTAGAVSETAKTSRLLLWGALAVGALVYLGRGK